MSRAGWQISGGPASRAYAEAFLRHGVVLIGPGHAGLWNPERDNDEFGGLAAEQERGPDFLRLANAFSALYTKGIEEKRPIDAMPPPVPR